MKGQIKALVVLVMLAPLLLVLSARTAQAVTIGKLDPEIGPVGQLVQLVGSLDGCGATYKIYWDTVGDDNVVAEGGAGSCVYLIVQFRIPEASKGRHRIILMDTRSLNEASYDFSVGPSVSTTISKGEAPSTIEVMGNGFAAGETNIQVTFDQKVVKTSITADGKGKWTAKIDIPETAGGAHYIQASGALTPPAEVKPTVFTITPRLTLSSFSGGAGAVIEVKGAGFGPSEADIKITFDDAPVKAALAADGNGSFQTTFVVPRVAKKDYVIDAQGPYTKPSAVPNIAFTVGTGVTLQAAKGYVGDRVAVTGSGFIPSESGIEITFDGLNAGVSNVTADANGFWTATLTLPAATAGIHRISAQGNTTKAGEVSSQEFLVLTQLKLQPTAAGSGASVTVHGTGFGKSQAVVITFEQTRLPVEVTTDTKGSFSVPFKVPAGGGENHEVSARDAAGNRGAASLFTETTPPPIPSPSFPEANAGIGASKALTFKWSDVSDPSGVSYIFELSDRADVQNPLVRQKDLTKAEYTLESQETLDTGAYFWRVRAVDGAGNESAWSKTQSFSVTGWNPVIPIAVAVVALLAVATLALWRHRLKQHLPRGER